jgi:hypothetical protein
MLRQHREVIKAGGIDISERGIKKLGHCKADFTCMGDCRKEIQKYVNAH